MKSILAILIVVGSLSANAAVRLSCKGQLKGEYPPGGISKIVLEAGIFHGTRMREVSAEVTFESYKGVETEVARAEVISADSKYKPTKYKNHKRFNLGDLTEVTRFSEFLPSDSCKISVLIPDTALESDTFKAPVTINCDQSGGKAMLFCELFEE